jgi:signal transduction histidine kinase/CheY-like chemotaxis protein
VRLIAVPVLLMFGIAVYVGAYHLLLFLIRRESKENLFFAFLCFSVAAYDFVSFGLYNSASVESGINWQKGQFFIIAPVALSVLFFASNLCGRKLDWFKRFFATAMVVLVSCGIVFNDRIFSAGKPIVREEHLLMFRIKYFEAQPALLMDIIELCVMLGMFYIFSILISAIVRQKRKELLPVTVGFFFFFLAAFSDILVGFNVLPFVYTTEYAFLLLIIMMDYTLLRRFVGYFRQIQTMNVRLEQKVQERTLTIRNQANELTVSNEELRKGANQLEEARIAADAANKAKSEFLANMSHEIRTPMNAVIGFGDLLRNTSLSDQQKDYVDTICSSGELLVSLINDVLDISKIESRKIELETIDFDLEYLIGSVLKILRQRIGTKGLELNLTYPAGVPREFKGDPTRIRQIIMNIAGNAIKFTQRGSITIGVEAGPAPEKDKSVLRIAVRDTGIGIPEDKIEAIFEAFTQVDSSITRTYGGTGLGLTITKSLVEMMGGTITVESELSKGSTFVVTLTLAHGNPSVYRDIALAHLETLRGKTAIIVDDNKQSLEILRNYCESAGMVVPLCAESAAAALGWLSSQAEPPDLVLSDIMMPGMDGYSFAAQIRKDIRLANVKLVALTSHAMPGSADLTGAAGFDAYLPKPFTRKDLSMTLRAIFGDQRHVKGRIITRHMADELMTKGLSVLVAEDNPLNQKLIGILLSNLGCVVEFANDGRAAVDWAEKKKFDIVFMDIQMPVMDGYEAAGLIRKRLQSTVPIIALTARAYKEDEERCRAAGMNDFLTKPISADTVKEKILLWTRG